MDLYVALRTAPKTARQRYGSPKGALDGDAATNELVNIILKVLEGYKIEAKLRPAPILPKTH